MIRRLALLALVCTAACGRAEPTRSSSTPSSSARALDEGAHRLRIEAGAVTLDAGQPIPLRGTDRAEVVEALRDALKRVREANGVAPRLLIESAPDVAGPVLANVIGTATLAGFSSAAVSTTKHRADVFIVSHATCPPDGLHEALVLEAYLTNEGHVPFAWVRGWGSEVGFPNFPRACRPFDQRCVRRVEALDAATHHAALERYLADEVNQARPAAVIIGAIAQASFGRLADLLDALVEARASTIVLDVSLRAAPAQASDPACRIDQPSREERAHRDALDCAAACPEESVPAGKACLGRCRTRCDEVCGSVACRTVCATYTDGP